MSTREDRLTAVVRARTATALSLTNIIAGFADPCSEWSNDPDSWPMLDSSLGYVQLESLHTAVMRLSGVSWDALAGYYDVTKQSLHRRLSSSVDGAVERAQLGFPAVDEVEVLGRLAQQVTHMESRLEPELLAAVQDIEIRSSMPGWWYR